ncbi:MAG: GMC family oxidoreductase [Halobacteriales archaeon]
MTDDPRSPVDDADVCVIGAGPAGALVAYTLASRGHRVVVLEAGERFDRAGDERRMEESLRPAHDAGEVWNMESGDGRDAYTSSGDRYYPLNAARVKGVGGSTLHWQGMVMRLHEKDFEMETRHGVGRDWPLSYDDLRPYYARAESELGVAGADDNPYAPPREDPFPLPAFEPSHSDTLFADACDDVGIEMHSVPNARNSESYDGRGACVGYGTCQPVCPSGAKYTADVHVRKAEEEGAHVIDRAQVERLQTDAAGDGVDAAVYTTPRDTYTQEADIFVVACGGVETPRLLLLSRSREHPDGLANSSGAVGRYFTEHLFAGAGGTVDERTRQNHVGFITSESHALYDGDQPTPLGTKLEFFNYAGPSPAVEAMNADDWGDDLLEDLRESYGNHVAMGGLVEQVPDPDNRVTLDDTKTDNLGNPVPDVRWSVGDREAEAIRAANDVQTDVLEAVDADVGWSVGPEDTGPAYHHMCTTRMGHHADESVVDPRTKAHDLDNIYVASSSVFVTAGAMNPTLTIAALALKTADHVDEEL